MRWICVWTDLEVLCHRNGNLRSAILVGSLQNEQVSVGDLLVLVLNLNPRAEQRRVRHLAEQKTRPSVRPGTHAVLQEAQDLPQVVR